MRERIGGLTERAAHTSTRYAFDYTPAFTHLYLRFTNMFGTRRNNASSESKSSRGERNVGVGRPMVVLQALLVLGLLATDSRLARRWTGL